MLLYSQLVSMDIDIRNSTMIGFGKEKKGPRCLDLVLIYWVYGSALRCRNPWKALNSGKRIKSNARDLWLLTTADTKVTRSNCTRIVIFEIHEII